MSKSLAVAVAHSHHTAQLFPLLLHQHQLMVTTLMALLVQSHSPWLLNPRMAQSPASHTKDHLVCNVQLSMAMVKSPVTGH